MAHAFIGELLGTMAMIILGAGVVAGFAGVVIDGVIIPLAALVGVPLCNTDAIATRTTNQEAVEMICRLAGKQQSQ